MSVAKPPGQKRGNPNKPPAKLETAVTVVPHTPPPPHLGPTGQSVWVFVVAEASAWLAPTDLPLVTLLCEAWERREAFTEAINHHGVLLDETRIAKGGDTYTVTKANPAVAMLADTEAQITRWLSLLGLSPSDRGRLGLQKVKAETTLERLRQSSRSGSGPTADSSSLSTSPQSVTQQSQPVTEPAS